MKKLILISLLSVLSLTALPVKASGDLEGPLGASIGLSSWVAIFVYLPGIAPALLGGASLSVSAGMSLMGHQKEAVRAAVNADAQDFYQAGNISLVLRQAITLLQDENKNLSDQEAVDMLVNTVNE